MHESFKQPILHKVAELNHRSVEHFTTVQAIVRELSAHIDGHKKIDKGRIAALVAKLTEFTLGVPVPIPLNSRTHFTRGVKYSEDDGGIFYRKTSRLSYIPKEFAHFAGQNRLNAAGEPIFYASLDTQNSSVNTVLTEIGATKGDVVNLLYSTTRVDHPGALHVVPIGIMAYFKRSMPAPFSLHSSFNEIYKFLRERTNPIAMDAVHLCDEFMDSILTTPVIDNNGKERPGLYDVTSALAKDFLDSPALDGILYQSTKSGNFPNVALRPKSVDEKLTHAAAAAYEVVGRDGEEGFSLKCLGNGIVESENIIWIL